MTPPTSATRSRTGTPVHTASALQPSTQVIGRLTVVCGRAASSASVNARLPSGPSTVSRYAGSANLSATPAAIAEVFTGTPCGPMSGRRGASTEIRLSGRSVCPTVAIVTTPAAAATVARSPRRDRPGRGSLGGLGPSPQGSPDDRQLDRDMQQQSADREPGDPVVRGDERERHDRVPVRDVEQATDDLKEGCRGEDQHRGPLQHMCEIAERRPREQLGVHRPELGGEQGDAGQPGRDVQTLRHAVQTNGTRRPPEPRGRMLDEMAEQTGSEADAERHTEREARGGWSATGLAAPM